ncbi:putative aldouronate transport system permease protein [Butyrivibrio fibrisolvens DSM 3071]|uniref:Putative aldouronate transport system permease protein n=1 Tax=Butyrivibrio fibrisolvens DSM 3071 TaxID=1121131 RepID=A0A1M6B2G5_BUTFI|nr:ABC transporter permease subunit [Butyrivibrio fibrisolvens]SHI42942.1 putative aldouronate transport system permease protein [Butyrivibrio fibrisolvens DSM 3071]
MGKSKEVAMAKAKPQVKTSWKKAFKRDWQLYLLLIFPLAMVFIFNYAAYPGLRMVFMNYKVMKGYSGSQWVGMKNFADLFTGPSSARFLMALKNSIVFNLLDLALGFPMPIILAVMLNELRFPKYKKVTQTILYLPHFLSWAVIGSIALTMFRTNTGLINMTLSRFGLIEQGIPFLTEKFHWAATYLLIGVWQGMGWGSILYLAAITGISGDLYEAAMIDGASRWQRIWHITLPGIRPTIVTLLIMNLGRLMGSNLERLVALDNALVRDFQYQLAVYIYDYGFSGQHYSIGTAANLFQSLVGLAMVLIADRVAKALGETGLL